MLQDVDNVDCSSKPTGTPHRLGGPQPLAVLYRLGPVLATCSLFQRYFWGLISPTPPDQGYPEATDG